MTFADHHETVFILAYLTQLPLLFLLLLLHLLKFAELFAEIFRNVESFGTGGLGVRSLL